MHGESQPRTYFVGRRLPEGAEVFAVTAKAVNRLGAGPAAPSELDWHGTTAAAMELSGQLLARATEERPSRDLQSRFALYFVPRLPHRGFVLDADDVRRWLRIAGEIGERTPASRRWWTGRFRAGFHGTASDA
jgi:hypothetical protein